MIRVLICEDEPPIRRAIVAMIERLDSAFEVTGQAQDGEQALKLLEEEPYDIVFTDIKMPVMNGLTLMEILAERHPGLIVCVISGYGTFEYTSHALRAHAFDYLLKPLSEEAMTQLLSRLKQEHLQRRRQRLTLMMPQGVAAPESSAQQVFVALFRARPEYWDERDLEALINDLLGTMSVFAWAFKGTSNEERMLILEARAGMIELIEYMHEYMLQQEDASVSCACLSASVELPDVEKHAERLSRALSKQHVERAFLVLDDESGAHKQSDANLLASRIAKYLDENYQNHITTQTLADRFGYVPSYISLLFRRSIGVSPTDYLNSVRLERAKQLMLKEPNMMVKEVAAKVGFKSQYHFSKAFKRYSGQWPSNFKGGTGI